MTGNRPTQLEIKRQELYDKLYARQPQLMERLNPFLRKAETIQDLTEPLSETEPLNVDDRKLKLQKELNKFEQESKSQKTTGAKKLTKISQIRPDVLWGLQ